MSIAGPEIRQLGNDRISLRLLADAWSYDKAGPCGQLETPPEQFSGKSISAGRYLREASPMTETEKEYYARRAREERKRARSAATAESHSIHDEIADLHREKANGSVNENGKSGIRRGGRSRGNSA